MSRVPTLSSPFLLGFEEIERALDRVAKAADGYPPYNVERLPAAQERPERIRITLAVAGFSRDELEVTVEENELVIARPPDATTAPARLCIAASPRGSSAAPSCSPTASRLPAPI